MVIYGFLWLSVVFYGYLRFSMVINGYLWLSMDSVVIYGFCGYPRFSMVINGYPWFLWLIRGFLWSSMVFSHSGCALTVASCTHPYLLLTTVTKTITFLPFYY